MARSLTCPRCGRTARGKAVFCLKCGTQLSPPPEAQTIPAEPPPAAAEPVEAPNPVSSPVPVLIAEGGDLQLTRPGMLLLPLLVILALAIIVLAILTGR